MKKRRGTVGYRLQPNVQLGILVAVIGSLVPAFAVAQQAPAGAPLTCTSKAGEHNVCPGDTSAGVALMKSTGPAACLLGKTWGYDDTGVWVADGCSGEFQLGRQVVSGASSHHRPRLRPLSPERRTNAATEPDRDVGRVRPRQRVSHRAEQRRRAVASAATRCVRYVNQMPGEQTFTDHLGNERPSMGATTSGRTGSWSSSRGGSAAPRLIYAVTFWTVNSTPTRTRSSATSATSSAGSSASTPASTGIPGTRSLQGSHPFWLGHDRVMADEFFRPFFGSGVWAQGEVRARALVQRGDWQTTAVRSA